MLIEQVTNQWVKYRVSGEDPKGAFLYVVSHYGAYSHQKTKVLADFIKAHPDLRTRISDDELSESFRLLTDNLHSKNEVLSPAELEWITEYVVDVNSRRAMEVTIYQQLLEASDHWDKLRQTFAWTISNREQKEIASYVLARFAIGSKRKIQLAAEFGLPQDDTWFHGYFTRLLWDRHYNQAAALQLRNVDKVVIKVIVDNLNAGYLCDAIAVARRFLPDREDLAQELREIETAFNR
jgi:hypothetical protein